MSDGGYLRFSRPSFRHVTIISVVLTLLAGILVPSAVAAPRNADDQARDDRVVAVELLKTGGRATKNAAEAALLGSSEQLREFVATGQHATIAHDNRVRVGQIMAVSGRRVREAAQAALGGSPEDVRRFLENGWQEPHRLDLRVQVGQIIAANGAGTRAAGQKALDGTAEDVLKFLADGQYTPQVFDRRKQVGSIMATGGTEVNKAARLALEGTDDDVKEFLVTGQHTARARDNEQASITELVNLAKAAGAEAAIETEAAKDASARAVAAAELAKQAAIKAAEETAAAKDDAAAAAAAAGRAADFANRAAQAAREAVTAANAANNAARIASQAATRAASAASAAAQAASTARGAAAAAAGDASQAANARAAAQHARDVAAGARLAADASKAAGEAANQAAGAARNASNAGANADRAAYAAEDAARQAGVSEAEAARARAAAADAHRFAAQANRAATKAENFAAQAATAAGDAYNAAIGAAVHAENAARAADEAADHAGEAADAAAEAEKHAQAAQQAATAATQAAGLADRIQKNAREADQDRLERLEQEGIAAAEKAKQELDQKAAWEAAEATRVDQETRRLLDLASALGADTATMLNNGRQAALRLRVNGGPWSRDAAERALAGDEQTMLDYLFTDREEAAEEDDRARVRFIAENTTIDKQRTAAQQAFLGDADELREFLRTKHYEGKESDDRKLVGQIMAKGGAATQRAGQAALDGTPDDVRQFIEVGQFESAKLDDRITIGQIISTGGPEVQAAGRIALAGPPAYAREFIQTGRFKAAQRDSLTASHVSLVQRLVSEAARIAATARSNAAEAARVAAVARNAANEAAHWAAEAQKSADEAKAWATKAKQSAQEAQASADRAAESARTARAAAADAEKAATAANLSATRAESSAARARASAADAAKSAKDARDSELAAGRDASLAQEAADEAYRIAATKQQDEQRAIAGGPLTAQEQADLAAVCKGDQACIDKYNKAVADANMSLLDFLKQEGAEIILEMIGYNDAVKCFTQGDVEACIWTIVNALSFANPIGLLTKGGKLVAAIAKIAGKIGKFLKRSAEAKDEVMAGRNAIHEAMRQCKLPLRPAGLAATTSVVMSDDSRKTTKDVVAGDRIASTDPATGQASTRQVATVAGGKAPTQMVTLTIDGSGKRSSVDASADQPFWVTERHAGAAAADIRPGEHLLTRDGKPATVVDVRSYTQVTQVYHLSPTDSDAFYVAAGNTAVLTLAAAKKADRFDYLNRDGYYNYVLKDKDDKIYYSGMFGGNQTPESVEYRHGRNRNRFDKKNYGDYLEPVPGSRTYGEARLLEHRLSEEHKTYIGRDEKTYRGNRQRPLAPSSMPEYNGYEARLKQLRGGSCP